MLQNISSLERLTGMKNGVRSVKEDSSGTPEKSSCTPKVYLNHERHETIVRARSYFRLSISSPIVKAGPSIVLNGLNTVKKIQSKIRKSMIRFQATTREKKENKTTKHNNNASFSMMSAYVLLGGYCANILAYTSPNWGQKDFCGLKRFRADCIN